VSPIPQKMSSSSKQASIDAKISGLGVHFLHSTVVALRLVGAGSCIERNAHSRLQGLLLLRLHAETGRSLCERSNGKDIEGFIETARL